MTYTEILKAVNDFKLPFHALYIDFKKAFDSVQHWTIMSILSKLNVHKSFIKSIEYILSNSRTVFKTEAGLTNPVSLKRGVKQGDSISSLLFFIYMLPLQFTLKKNKSPSDSFYINHICYADDLLIFASDHKSIISYFNIVQAYCIQTHLQINEKKSAISSINANTNWNLNSLFGNIARTEQQNHYKYLGILVALDLNNKGIYDSAINKANFTLHSIIKKRYIRTNLKIKLINSMVYSPFLYIAQIIFPDATSISTLENNIAKCLNKSIGLTSTAPHPFWYCYRNLIPLNEYTIAKFINVRISQRLNSEDAQLGSLISNQANFNINKSLNSLLKSFNGSITMNNNLHYTLPEISWNHTNDF